MTENAPAKKAYKDSLFRMIYGGRDERSRRWLLSLYNALSGKSYEDPALLEITTIEDVIYVSMKNDLSFLIDSQMHLYEHQSSVNPNMPLRGLFYFAKLYQREVEKADANMFGTKLIRLPSPRFLVFYNGDAELPDTKRYYLSDAFLKEEGPDFPLGCGGPDARGKEFEWTATLININKNRNETLQKKCESLYHYSAFVGRVKENLAKSLPADEAVDEAVDFAIRGNFLDGLFREQKVNILGDLLTEFDEEAFLRRERRDAREERALEDARNFLAETDLPPDKIARCCSLPLETVLALRAELRGTD